MHAYHSFAREQRPLLSNGLSPGGRERLLSQRWKALSKAEKAHYKGCEDTILTLSFVAYSAFCLSQRPLLPPTLSNSQREASLGQLWAALPEGERAEYGGGSRATVPAPPPAPSAPVPTPASALQEKDGSKSKRPKTAASMVAPSVPESTAVPLAPLAPAAPLAPPTGSAPPVFALTAPSSASTSPTASHSLSTDTNDDDYEWEKYLSLEEGFISSSLDSLDALHVQETSEVLMEQL